MKNKTKANKQQRKHTITLNEDVWSYIDEQARKNDMTHSEFIDKTFEYMKKTGKEVVIEYRIYSKNK